MKYEFKYNRVLLILGGLGTISYYFYTRLHSPELPTSSIKAEFHRLKADPKNYYFDWSNWLDISFADEYDKLVQNEEHYPALHNEEDIDFEETYTGPLNRDESKLLNAKVLLDYKPAPQQIISLPATKSGLPTENAAVYQVRHSNPKRDHIRQGLSEYVDLSSLISADADLQLPRTEDILNIDLDKSLYEWNIDQEIEVAHPYAAPGMQMAADLEGIEPKYFHESTVSDAKDFSIHYDMTFFQRVETRAERTLTLELLFRAWSEFALSYNLPYAVAHGSALGWFWNGMSLPWDVDMDIQMPIQTLHQLAVLFNNTLVVPNANTNNSRAYMIDVNPYYVTRERGNGENVIDARFIDITTGTYIDITGLSSTKLTAVDHFRCRNSHDYAFTDIARLELTRFEGALAYVYRDTKSLLRREFKNSMLKLFQGWLFNDNMRLWIKRNKNCMRTVKFPQEVCFEQHKLKSSECRSDLDSCDSVDIEEYEASKSYTEYHTVEVEFRNSNLNNDDKEAVGYVDSMLIDHFKHEFNSIHRLPGPSPLV